MAKIEITPKQKKLFNFITRHKELNGRYPGISTISSELGYNNAVIARNDLKMLEAKNWIVGLYGFID